METLFSGGGSIQIKGVFVSKYEFESVAHNEKLDITDIRLEDQQVVIDYVSNWSQARGCKKINVLKGK